MKTHTSNFKEEIKLLGKQQSVRITYKENNITKTLTDEDINSATPNYEASLLKSVMKVLELDSNINIPKGTEIKFEYGLLVNGAYEYLDYGNYIVAKEPEKQEDTLSYKITCYDKMLYSMKDYEHIEITYPCTIKEYLIALCNKIGLEFKDSTFANQDREIQNELFMTTNEDGTYSSMGYTYRDVLDQIAETTGGCICLTLDDKVEVRYVNKTINYEQSEKSNIIQFKTEVEEPIILERLEGLTTQKTSTQSSNLFDEEYYNNDDIYTTSTYKYVKARFTGNRRLYFKATLKEGKTAQTGSYIAISESKGSPYVAGTKTAYAIINGSAGTNSIDFSEITDIYVNIYPNTLECATIFDNYNLWVSTDNVNYEPFVPNMPSPDYPSEIENIEGNIEVKVEGKNKFDKSIYTNSTYNGYFLKNILKVGQNYTISFKNIENKTYGFLIKPKLGVAMISDMFEKYSKTAVTFNYTQAMYDKGYTLFITSISDYQPLSIDEINNMDIQLEEGSTATDYEPYKSQVATFPLGEEKLMEGSYLADDGVHHSRKQVILGDITSLNSVTVFGVECQFAIYTFPDAKNTGRNYNFLSDRISPANETFGQYKGYRNGKQLLVLTTADDTVENFNSKISGSIVEYDLAEPEVVPYTEEQKTILTSIKTMKGTNIFEFPSDTIISYPINYDTIDEEYINNTNVSFGEKYGAINSIVLARAGESDKIYKKDQASIEKNGLCELMISENQFMNFNDRADYLQGLADKLFGVEYYLNDFTSTGIMYYDLLDVYNVKIGDKTYNCLMLNDEQDITQGLEENIYTERPEKSETDYTKADKTDRKINQTNLIVDKQNQKIEGVISQIGDRSNKTTTITADIDGINSKVTNIADLTNTVSGIKTITLENCVEGRLLELNILGNNTVFDYLFPNNDLYPSNTLFTRGDSRITVTNYKNNSEESNSTRTYELGIVDVLRQKNNVYDEYILKEGKAQVIRRINKDGTIKDNEEIEYLGEYLIYLQEGTNIIEIQNYSAQIRAKFAIKSDYTDVFATKVEMNSEIKQTADSINLEVRKKVDENEVISKINQSAEAVGISANKIELSANDVLNLLAGNSINLTSKNIIISSEFLNIDKKGNMIFKILGTEVFQVQNSKDSSKRVYITDQGVVIDHSSGIDRISMVVSGDGEGMLHCSGNGTTWVKASGITTPILTQTSLAEQKKNFEKLQDNALETIKGIDIYKYNLKNEKDTDKKHIGFIIGDNYNYSKEVTSIDNQGVDNYSFTSLCCKAIQELTAKIEKLENKIK